MPLPLLQQSQCKSEEEVLMEVPEEARIGMSGLEASLGGWIRGAGGGPHRGLLG